MAKKTPPRKMRLMKAALAAAEAASVEIADSNCSQADTLEAVSDYELYGLGNPLVSYANDEVTDFAKTEDQAKQVTGKDSNGAVASVKDASDVIGRSLNAGLSTLGANYYFDTTQTVAGALIPSGGRTGSNVVNFVYGKNGPQAPYIPQLVHAQDGLTSGTEYVFFLPANVTGAAGANMPVDHSRSFEVNIQGALAPGESIQVFTASADGTREATGSAFTFSASYCTLPNFHHQQFHIPTGNIASDNPATSQAGIVVVYTASYTEADNKENTPYAGVVVSIFPSALIT